MKRYKVVKDRQALNGDVIRVNKGDRVQCLEISKQEEWAGWILCRKEMVEGWIPKQIIDIEGSVGTIKEHYDAREMDIFKGEIIVAYREMNGWIWGAKEGKIHVEAWAPLNYMERI